MGLFYCPVTRLRIVLARVTLSPITLVNLGLGVEMSSRPSLMAAIIADAITSVEA